MSDTMLVMTAGLPYSRRIRIKNVTNVWPTVDDFEVHSQIRVSNNPRSTLKGDLSEYITATIDGTDIVLDLRLTGSQTRSVSSGYYDIVISDPTPDAARGIKVLGGQIQIKPLVTVGV
jgi:hypothetical protein